MDMATLTVVYLALLGLFIVLSFPIGFALILSSTIALFLQDLPFSMGALKMIAGADSFLLTAIPFFIFAGVLMRIGGVTQRILDCCLLLLGTNRAALAHVNIVASMIFGGISGSSVADTASIGSILIPEMIRKKYPPAVSAAITAASSTIGIVIPPSIPIILYAMVTEVSVGRLFLAGAIPGVLVGLFMMLIVAFLSRNKHYAVERKKMPTLDEVAKGLKDGILAITMPLVIIGESSWVW